MKRPNVQRHIPSFFTLINLFLGFLAILNVQSGNFTHACYYILIAGVFDSLDGKIARKVGITSSFGTEIDSLADMVSFCLAPSVLVYTLYTKGLPGISGELIAATPLILGAIRLAKFNTLHEESPKSYFIGLPTPVNALAIVSLVLWTESMKLTTPEYTQPRLLIPIIIYISFLMVSKIKYPKFPLLNIKSGTDNNMRLFGLVLFMVCFIVSFFYDLQFWILMGFASFYILYGIIKRLTDPDYGDIPQS